MDQNLLNWIDVLHNEASSCVISNGDASSFFRLQRGVKQRCPLSGLLFIIGTELFARALKNDQSIKGINAEAKERDEDSVEQLLRLLNELCATTSSPKFCCQWKVESSARNLGFIVDDSLSLEEHVNSISKSCYYPIRRVAKIQKYVSEDSSAALLHAFITCRLDKGNALLYGLPKYLIQLLQVVQNFAARLVSCKPRYARATSILRALHWLPVESRIIFKILLLVHKSLNNLAPAYIYSLLENYKPRRNLRSVDQGLLTIPRSNQRTYGDRAFSVATAKLWNALPLDIRNN